MSKKAYLAAPFFTDVERQEYDRTISYLREKEGYDLFVPAEHTIPNAWELSNDVWARKVFEEDVRAIDEADIIFVMNYGMYSDSGTAWEMGYAYAKGKKVINIICHTLDEVYSLMCVNGCDENWLFNFKHLDPKEVTQK